jgi:hypothetical protein
MSSLIDKLEKILETTIGMTPSNNDMESNEENTESGKPEKKKKTKKES